MAVGREGLASAALGLARLKLWGALSFLFGGRRALFYNITARRLTRPEEFKADMAQKGRDDTRHFQVGCASRDCALRIDVDSLRAPKSTATAA